MKCVWYHHPYFLCFCGSLGFLYMLAVHAGTLQTWCSVIVKVSKISKWSYERAGFLISWIGWHSQSTHESLVLWFKNTYTHFFIPSEGKYCLFSLRNLHNVTHGALSSPKRVAFKYREVRLPLLKCRHIVCFTPGFWCNRSGIILAF